MQNNLFLEGIKTNNLKNINIEIQRDAMNLILGPSGSGKSSLAYETIAQIGQHEYLSMFADNVPEPTYKVQSFENMLPAVPIKQTNNNNNLRSSIGTYFGISRKIGLVYSALLGIDDDFFVLNKEENVCENCHGLGTSNLLDINKIINYNVPIKNIPFRCWNRYKDFFSQILIRYCEDSGIDSAKHFNHLNEFEKQKLLYGISESKYSIKFKKLGRLASRTTKYYGILQNRTLLPGFSIGKDFYSDVECTVCHGLKYNDEHLKHKLHGLSIGEFLTTEFDSLLPIVSAMAKEVLDDQLKFVLNRIYKFVQKAIELKLGYLCFNRSIPTLSGGELQRLRLVQVFNTQLSNLLIVLDEPLAGLSNNEKPIIKQNILELLNDNTLIVVDHGTAFLDTSKKVICLGESGGRNGGFLIDTKRYIESQNVRFDFKAPKPKEYFNLDTDSIIYHYTGAHVDIALNRMNLITGDSGVGKSTLLREYFPQIFDDYTYVNQKPMLGNKNSTVITALDIFTRVTSFYGVKFNKDTKFFSNFTGNAGCCIKCGGSGYIEYGDKRTSLIKIECQQCQGTGFNGELKKYSIQGKSIIDIWHLTVDEALDYFQMHDQKIIETLCLAKSIMLGHLKLGQPTSTLSGGENIRLKMLKCYNSKSKVLGIDEPFKGLNNTEKEAVGLYLHELSRKGKTILIIDHTEDISHFFSNHIVVRCIDNKIVGQ